MKAVILDMYGVILKDPGEGFYTYVNRTFPNLSSRDIYQHWDKADVGEISSLEVLKRLGFKGDLEKIEKEYLDTVDIDESFYEFATNIKKNYKLALISNDSSEWSRYFRDKYKVNDYFDAITISGDLKIKKPDERIFKYTLEKLGCLASDCTYIDDRRYNLAAAESLGMETILFNSRNVQYEGKTVVNFKELENMLAKL
ncbi:putative hydrolase of the HAD superfamily [Natranaerovirga pectinivora]|uniref:Putative hydrolase of the HAD superfamily n=1 Tax=Natranaerovirga pectinivora TaxID=682400 RepID=A0A4R3MPG5_9FIRM|nr:HAD family phosphatase [Natranaerovirga pectinivora]TCT14862.1 putative hydrolase of the HAD superfamily [Natranaerovirga pectinivora]